MSNEPTINIAGIFADPYVAAEQARRLAYSQTADPLFFGWQRGENTEQEWLDAVQAVKDSYPYPVKESK